MRYLIAFLFMLPSLVFACPKLSYSQQQVVHDAYEYGKPHGFGWTMAAIVLRESSAGVQRVNNRTGDYGYFQISLLTATRRAGIEYDSVDALYFAIQLTNDFELGAKYALMELQYWKSKRGSWRDIVASYNAGWNKAAGAKYAQDIADNVVALRTCNWLEESAA